MRKKLKILKLNQKMQKVKHCIICLLDNSLSNFSKDKSRKDGLNPRCKTCIRSAKLEFWQKNKDRVNAKRRSEYWRDPIASRAKKNNARNAEKDNARQKRYRKEKPLKFKRYALKRDFGIELEEYEKMLQHQNGACKICKYSNGNKKLAVDHDHKTGKIRGLLCQSCNLGLGHFKDDQELLQLASLYLEGK